MHGDLARSSVAGVCLDLAGDARTGVLSIAGSDAPGTITFSGGRIVAASSPVRGARLEERLVAAGLVGSVPPDAAATAGDTARPDDAAVDQDAVRLFWQEQILDALVELVRWRHGSFDFHPSADVDATPASLGVDVALTEVARRHEQWKDLATTIPDLEAVPTPRVEAGAVTTGLEPDEATVLAGMDGSRSVRRLAEDLGYGEFEVARVVFWLVEQDLVAIALPEDEIGAALDDALAYLGHGHDSGDRPPFGEHGDQATDWADATGGDDAAGSASDGTPDPADWTPDPADGTRDPADAGDETRGPRDDTPDPADPTVASGDDVGEAGEDTYSDVLREFRSLDELAAAPGPDLSQPEPPERPASPSQPDPLRREAPGRPPTSPSARRGGIGDDDDDPAEDGAGDDSHAEDADVAEFLRELSRLSVDEDPEPRDTGRRPPAPNRDTTDDESKRRKRGFFGRG